MPHQATPGKSTPCAMHRPERERDGQDTATGCRMGTATGSQAQNGTAAGTRARQSVQAPPAGHSARTRPRHQTRTSEPWLGSGTWRSRWRTPRRTRCSKVPTPRLRTRTKAQEALMGTRLARGVSQSGQVEHARTIRTAGAGQQRAQWRTATHTGAGAGARTARSARTTPSTRGGRRDGRHAPAESAVLPGQ
jgi:hypothetical protein